MLGWLHSLRKDWTRAHDWFSLALADADPAKTDPSDLKSAQGDAQALREMGRNAEAEELAFRWKDRDPSLTLFYMSLIEPELTRPTPISIEDARLKRFSDVVVSQQSGSGAQALGWYAYNLGQFATARAWFEKAMTWQPRDTTVLGYALSLQNLGDKAALKAFVDANVATYPSLASINAPRAKSAPAPVAAPALRTVARQAPAEAVTARGGGGGGGTTAAPSRRKDYAGCVSNADRLAAGGRLDARAALQKGWCLMGSIDRRRPPSHSARRWAILSTAGDAAYGQALALLRGGQAEQAAMAANAAPMAETKRNEIGVAVLSDRAVSAFDSGRYNDTIEALDQRRSSRPSRGTFRFCAAGRCIIWVARTRHDSFLPSSTDSFRPKRRRVALRLRTNQSIDGSRVMICGAALFLPPLSRPVRRAPAAIAGRRSISRPTRRCWRFRRKSAG